MYELQMKEVGVVCPSNIGNCIMGKTLPISSILPLPLFIEYILLQERFDGLVMFLRKMILHDFQSRLASASFQEMSSLA